MMRRTLALTLLVVGGFLPAVLAEDALIRTLSVKPETCYRLSFKAEIRAGKATWLLRMSDRHGEFPHDGCHERDWQQIVPGEDSYTHSFLTPPDAAVVCFGIRSEGQKPQISDVKIEQITPKALLINGDFSAGPGDYSGWTEHFNAVFVEEQGKLALKVEHNGYVLIDRIRVVGGGEYRYAPGSTTATSILAYDADTHLIQIIPYHHKSPVFKMPDKAAYLRLLYQTWHDHIPAYRTKTIAAVGLLRTGSRRTRDQGRLPAISWRDHPGRGV